MNIAVTRPSDPGPIIQICEVCSGAARNPLPYEEGGEYLILCWPCRNHLQDRRLAELDAQFRKQERTLFTVFAASGVFFFFSLLASLYH